MRNDRQISADETGEPEYQRGLQLEKQGRPQEALAAYLKVIALRGEDSSPESHLEAGVIYLQHVKDPLEAIRHFKKYLELQPNSKEAGLVRQQIDAAKRDFARTLLAQPLENPSDRIKQQDQIASLQRENDQLKAELAALRNGSPVPKGDATVIAPSARSRAVAAPGGGEPVTLVETAPAVTSAFAAPTPPPAAVPRAAPPSRASTPKAASKSAPASARRYTVQPKDTLFRIAQRYPGTGGVSARAQAIFEANRDVMKSETDLRPGMELRIP
jgi:tetratricopeptide (TPR) repeat protein